MNTTTKGQPCAYCGKFATGQNVDYSKYQLDLAKPLCYFCQQKPERVKIFQNPPLTGVEMGLEPSDEHSSDIDDGGFDDPNYPPEPYTNNEDFERSQV